MKRNRNLLGKRMVTMKCESCGGPNFSHWIGYSSDLAESDVVEPGGLKSNAGHFMFPSEMGNLSVNPGISAQIAQCNDQNFHNIFRYVI